MIILISELYKKNFDYLCRHDYEHEEEIASLLKELNLKDCYIIDNYIFSHAGFNNHCQDIFKLNLETRKLCYASGKEITEI